MKHITSTLFIGVLLSAISISVLAINKINIYPQRGVTVIHTNSDDAKELQRGAFRTQYQAYKAANGVAVTF